MKRLLSTIAIAGLVATSLHSKPAQAQDPPLDCAVVESLGSALSANVLADINARTAGARYRLSRRKTLVVNSARSVSFRGCQLSLDLDVTLERRIRRNAHGNIVLRANISSFDLADREICYTDLKVIDVDLSRTLGVGEAFYRGFANAFLPNSGCLS